MINCPKCNILFDEQGKWGIKQFCSRSCANSRGPRSQAVKDAISATLSGTVGHTNIYKGCELVEREDRFCKECSKTFRILPSSSQIYCSKECRTPHIGGYRQGSGRSKSGYYKGIYCGSTYELAWVIYRLDHNLSVKRFDGYILYGDNKKYYPDFIDNNCVIEIKGWTTTDTDIIIEQKMLASSLAGYKVILLKKEDLQKEFCWIIEKYNTNKVYTLYDEYSPVFNYVCNHCNTEFGRNHRIKTENKFCSRVCAGLNNKGKKIQTNIS
jgi:hypothetical protein